jgi:hypothetical protein
MVCGKLEIPSALIHILGIGDGYTDCPDPNGKGHVLLSLDAQADNNRSCLEHHLSTYMTNALCSLGRAYYHDDAFFFRVFRSVDQCPIRCLSSYNI